MRTALISGAARGIGAAVARHLAATGWRLVLLDRDLAGAATAAAIGEAARFVQADVSREDEVSEAMASLDRLDGLVCNAGFIIRKPLETLSLAEWNAVIGTNLTGCFLLTRAAASLLCAAGGAIVTIASTRAHMSERDTESYSASKGGLLALTHALAISLGPDVRANCISPGWIATADVPLTGADHAQHPAGRVGRPGDVAEMVEFLLSPRSSFVTGSEFIIDGGMTRKMIYAE